MLMLRRRHATAVDEAAVAPTSDRAPASAGVVDAALLETMSRHASETGREAAEVRGAIADAHAGVAAQAAAMQSLAAQVREVTQAQAAIGEAAGAGREAVARAGDAVRAVGGEVGAVVETLREVGTAAGQITQIALQTRLVAFNASVEAKRAGDAGRGFGVVADAVKDLAAQVESSSKRIMGTIAELDARIATLAREIRARDGAAEDAGAVHRALDEVAAAVDRIGGAARDSAGVCGALDRRMGSLETDMHGCSARLDAVLGRTETFLQASEQMIEALAASGHRSTDTPYIEAAQRAAAQIAAQLERALAERRVGRDELFDEDYRPVPGTDPQQHMTRFVALAEDLFPAVQEPVLQMSDKVVFCIAVARNGYIPCHNRQYNHAQRAGDAAWNQRHARGRRIFDDRTGLASARNRRPFLLQTYRRDMGGGQFVVMKEVAVPITVGGRHWGGLRLAFRF